MAKIFSKNFFLTVDQIFDIIYGEYFSLHRSRIKKESRTEVRLSEPKLPSGGVSKRKGRKERGETEARSVRIFYFLGLRFLLSVTSYLSSPIANAIIRSMFVTSTSCGVTPEMSISLITSARISTIALLV